MTDNQTDYHTDAYQAFIEESINCGCLWGLEGPDGWALCSSEKYDNTEVMPFWSQPEYAEAHCQEEWQDYKVVPIALTEFIDEWLPGMHNDVFLVGVNFDTEMEGDEVEPLDLLADYDKATAED